MKVGYSSGIYGCSGEYFKCVYTSKIRGLSSFQFGGLYGAEERVGKAMEKAGYKLAYNGSGYGKMTRAETKYFLSEYETITPEGKLVVELDK